MNPPPGNSGGAVSGAGPCALAVETQSKKTSANRRPFPYPIRFRNLTSFSLQQRQRFQAHERVQPGTTGGQTRCEEAGKPGNRRWAGRGIALRRSEQRNPNQRIRPTLAQLRIERGKRTYRAQTRAAQKDRAWLAWSCSNPDHGDGATSNALNCSTASPVLASSWHCSRMHTPRERLRVPPEKLA